MFYVGFLYVVMDVRVVCPKPWWRCHLSESCVGVLVDGGIEGYDLWVAAFIDLGTRWHHTLGNCLGDIEERVEFYSKHVVEFNPVVGYLGRWNYKDFIIHNSDC